jgi:RNA polymerase sigma-70 factor (ECF subfamily)
LNVINGVPTLADLYDEYGPRLYRYAVLILGDRDAAEDALQEAFCQFAQALRKRQDIGTLAYVTTIVRNECYSRLRRRRRSRAGSAVPLLEPAAPDAHPDEQVMVEQALRSLPPEQREVIYLKVYEGLTFQEIGDRCGVSLNTAASRYRYALEALRRVLVTESRPLTSND